MNRKRVLPIAIGLVAVVLVVWFVWLRGSGADGPLDASGTVEATDAQLGFEAAGRIDTILVHEGDRVKAGQELARLDQSELRARRQQAVRRSSRRRRRPSPSSSAARAPRRSSRGATSSPPPTSGWRTRSATSTGPGGCSTAAPSSRESLDKAQLAFDVAQSQHDQAGAGDSSCCRSGRGPSGSTRSAPPWPPPAPPSSRSTRCSPTR